MLIKLFIMFGDCVIKKARLREDDPPDGGGEDVTMEEAFERSMSFKECMVGSTGGKHNESMVQEDEYIALIKGDVQKDWIDRVPSICFLERVHTLIEKKNMVKTVVLKLLGRKIRYTALWNKICALWKLSQDF